MRFAVLIGDFYRNWCFRRGPEQGCSVMTESVVGNRKLIVAGDNHARINGFRSARIPPVEIKTHVPGTGIVNRDGGGPVVLCNVIDEIISRLCNGR